MTQRSNHQFNSEAVALSSYWDDCVATRDRWAPKPPGINQELASVILDLEQLAAGARAPVHFADRGLSALLEQRMEAQPMTASIALRPVFPPPPPPRTASGMHWRVFATAAALLLLLSAVPLLLADRWHGSTGLNSPVIVAPDLGAEASPDPAQIGLLWQWNFTSKMHNIDTYLQVAESPSGQVYVSEDIASQVHVLDAAGNEIDAIEEADPDLGRFAFGNPNNGWYGGQLGFDRNGNLYVFDSGQDRIFKLGPENALLAYWDIPKDDNPNHTQTFRFVVGAVDPINERVYVATQVTPQMYVYDLDGNLLSSWGTPGREPGELSTPSAIAVAPDGTLWIADKSISRIQHFDVDGTYLGSIGERGGAPGQVNGVLGLAIDEDGNIYAAEAGNGRVQVMSPDGTSLFIFNSVPELGRIIRPNSLWVGSDGVLYVVDSKNDRVLKLQLPSLR